MTQNTGTIPQYDQVAGVALPIDPTPFIHVAAPRGHRRKFGKHPRVMMPGATVDVSTARLAKRWRGKTLSLGLLLDQVFAFAKRKNFKPVRVRK